MPMPLAPSNKIFGGLFGKLVLDNLVPDNSSWLNGQWQRFAVLNWSQSTLANSSRKKTTRKLFN